MQNKPLHFKQAVLAQTLLTGKALLCLLLLLMVGYFSSLPDILKNISAATSGFSNGGNNTVKTVAAFFADADSDDDGIPDAIEGTTDPDGDGVNNSLDLDSDNDGIPDIIEAGGTDTNNDGKADGVVDADLDGLIDIYDPSEGGTALTNRDMDGDGIPNSRDRDSDGDGIPDVEEAGFPHGTGLAIISGSIGVNGWSVTVDAMLSINLTNSDGDIYPNYLDIDSDNDGITDNVEGQFTDTYILPSGFDADGDGIDDSYDQEKIDPFNLIYNYQGLIPVNFQGAVDVLPDYIDPDTDDDNIPDIIEGHDANKDNIADYTLLGTDADGDGLDDAFDLVTGPNVKNEGMNGIPTPPFAFDNEPANPPNPGARGPLQMTLPNDLDRTWRIRASTLPVTLLSFGAEKQADNSILLSWNAENEVGLKEYILERSTDGVNFQSVATVAVKGGLRPAYVNLDNTANQAGTKLYYRLKQVDIDGRITYSRILSVNLIPISGISLVMTPNPAQDNVALKIAAAKKRTALVNIIDYQGRVLAAQRISIAKGDNIIPLRDATRLANGIYTVLVNTGEEKIAAKLIIQK